MHDFILDNDDVKRVNEHHWCIFHTRNRNDDLEFFYASTNDKKLPSTLRLLHRFINNTEKGFQADHIDGNTLNMRKSNLRQCTAKENGKNKARPCNNTSGTKGVGWDNTNQKWIAYLKLNKHYKQLGYYDDINDAIDARKRAEIKYQKEYSRDYGDLAI